MRGRAGLLVGTARVARVAGYVWGAALVFFHLLGLVIRFNEAETIWQGVWAVSWAISPANIAGYFFLAVAAIPTVAAIALAESLEMKARREERAAELATEQQAS